MTRVDGMRQPETYWQEQVTCLCTHKILYRLCCFEQAVFHVRGSRRWGLSKLFFDELWTTSLGKREIFVMECNSIDCTLKSHLHYVA